MQEMLSLAELADPREVEQILGPSANASLDVEKALLRAGIVNESMLYSLLRAVYLIQNGFLFQEDAIMALHQCKLCLVSMDEALKQLGWTAGTRRKS